MAVNHTTDGYELPCERELDQVWERLDAVGEGLADEHELSCPHCRTARESLLALREATQELVEESEQPPPDLVGRIMSAVRAEVRRGQMLRLPTSEAGFVEVSEQAVAVVLRYAADSVGGVRARRCRVRTVDVGENGESLVEVELTLAVSLRNVTGSEALTKVRERVAAAAAARVGLELVRLDLLVDDVYEDEE
ncbi:Asp23/Gls24 family envelope stress response protein [Amycolatopsis sp. H20-H5]|uniref:Asp23/Gls24 family envelope stress response protein n=1 Tax=Amycolatopsis sp. H20-H5 TaxID=3046309 RepID=UPI002DB95EF2|nr:Asp23/Gls24 family envelope stress response protein [Amycolatopsis sp. H20-H5]MEC3975638.1 Asp23/Gls24 family envelope stress response protein [Amycolatopsis sp. H20-H5]